MNSLKSFLTIVSIYSTFHAFGGNNIIDAKKLLTEVSHKNGYAAAGSTHYKIEGKGKYFSDSHLEDPEQLREYGYTFSLESGLVTNSHLMKSIFKSDTNVVGQETKLYVENDEFILNTKDSNYIKTNETNKWEGLSDINRLAPQFLVSHLLANFDKLSVSAGDNGSIYTITFKDLDNKLWNFTVLKEQLVPLNVSTKHYHYLLGDVELQYAWKEYKRMDGINFPAAVSISDNNFTTYQYKQSFKTMATAAPELIKVPVVKTVSETVLPEDRLITRDSIFIQPIAKNIYAIELPQTNNRLLAAEFKDYLFLLEGSYHSKNGDLILSVLKDRFPNKPVRYWSFSHCHTQYIGFARSICSNGAAIVSSEGNRKYINRLCANKHQLRPDLQESLKSEPKFIPLTNNTWKIKDELNELEIHNIGPNHTNEYSVFYFPQQKTIFAGDLCWVDKNKSGNMKERSMKLYESIATKLNLDFDQLYISWPIRGYDIETVVSRDAFKKAYEQTLKKNQ